MDQENKCTKKYPRLPTLGMLEEKQAQAKENKHICGEGQKTREGGVMGANRHCFKNRNGQPWGKMPLQNTVRQRIDY